MGTYSITQVKYHQKKQKNRKIDIFNAIPKTFKDVNSAAKVPISLPRKYLDRIKILSRDTVHSNISTVTRLKQTI